MKGLISFVCASAILPALALAQPAPPPKTATEWYKDGETQYNLGNFLPAVEAFKKGYELEPVESKKAAYIYNIAQAYRQAKDCGQSQFFYKRYLALKDGDTVKPLDPKKRQEIEDRIKELDDCVKQQEAIRNRPPDTTFKPDNEVTPPDGPSTKPKQVGDTTPTDTNTSVGPDDNSVTTTVTTAPKLLSVRAVGGVGKVFTGPDIAVPVQPSFALIGGYPLELAPKMGVDIGAGFTFTPVPLQGMGTAKLIGAFANGGLSYEVAPKISVRADVGVGVLVFGGVSGSRFTGGAMTSGALAMVHVRAGLSADYAITPNLIATLVPFAFSYSPPKQGLDDSIKAIAAIDFMAGIGYRM